MIETEIAAATRLRGLDLAFSLYKRVLSPALHALSFGSPQGCRYQPTCSEYATLACAQHGLLRGTLMAAWRLLRCNPFSPGGWDPVPIPRHDFSPAANPPPPHTGTIEDSGARAPSSNITRD